MAAGFSTATVEVDFTTQLLYASVKTGLNIGINDMGLNVLLDLVNFASEIESQALSGGKGARSSKPMSVADMTKRGRTRL